MATKAKKKSKNFIAAYFKPFGLRQLCDILMLAGAIVIFVGFFTEQIVITVGIAIYMFASLLAIFRSVRVLFNKDINKRSPERRNAIINIVVMSVLVIIGVLALLAGYLNW